MGANCGKHTSCSRRMTTHSVAVHFRVYVIHGRRQFKVNMSSNSGHLILFSGVPALAPYARDQQFQLRLSHSSAFGKLASAGQTPWPRHHGG